jgi:hypothetical protein
MRLSGRLAGFGLAACLPIGVVVQAHGQAPDKASTVDPHLGDATPVAGVTVVAHKATVVDGVTVTLCTAAARTPDPAAKPPMIVETSPAQGATVPTGWAPLSLTFDQPMSNCSFAYSPDYPLSFPQLSGQPPVIRDRRTLVLMVFLKPGQTYGLKLNDAQHPFFIGRSGLSAMPMELRFSTAR